MRQKYLQAQIQQYTSVKLHSYAQRTTETSTRWGLQEQGTETEKPDTAEVNDPTAATKNCNAQGGGGVTMIHSKSSYHLRIHPAASPRLAPVLRLPNIQ